MRFWLSVKGLYKIRGLDKVHFPTMHRQRVDWQVMLLAIIVI